MRRAPSHSGNAQPHADADVDVCRRRVACFASCRAGDVDEARHAHVRKPRPVEPSLNLGASIGERSAECGGRSQRDDSVLSQRVRAQQRRTGLSIASAWPQAKRRSAGHAIGTGSRESDPASRLQRRSNVQLPADRLKTLRASDSNPVVRVHVD